jgi:hypothetical protein
MKPKVTWKRKPVLTWIQTARDRVVSTDGGWVLRRYNGQFVGIYWAVYDARDIYRGSAKNLRGAKANSEQFLRDDTGGVK